MEQYAIDDTEDGGRAGDAESKCDERGESEARVLQQHPKSVAKIVKERVHIRGAHAPRVLVSAPSPKQSVIVVRLKFAMARAPSPAREGACAPQRIEDRMFIRREELRLG